MKKENNDENSGPLTSLPVDRLTATDCNADRLCQKNMASSRLALSRLILLFQYQCASPSPVCIVLHQRPPRVFVDIDGTAVIGQSKLHAFDWLEQLALKKAISAKQHITGHCFRPIREHYYIYRSRFKDLRFVFQRFS